MELVMGTRIAVLVSLTLLAACGDVEPPLPSGDAPGVPEAPSLADPDADRVWGRMMETISPDGGWDRARYLEFHWAVARDGEPLVREHRWDRWEGRARVEAPTDAGRMVAIFEVANPEGGRVWLDDRELSGEEAAERLASAHRAHVNDGYWLVMPFKWADPGVNARYAGSRTDEVGRSWEVVELTFDGDTGLTPQNMYRAFVNPETWRMERWHFLSTPDAEPSPIDWTDWRRVGPIELAENRRSDGEPRIFFPHLQVQTEVPDGAFDPPG
jgi:hypothetical protein